MLEHNPGAVLAHRRERRVRDDQTVRVIAAATDFTPTSHIALRRAARLAHVHGSRVALMHVSTPLSRLITSVKDVFAQSRHAGRATALDSLNAMAASIASEFDVRVDVHMATGELPSSIAVLAQAVGADLVVVGNSAGSLLANLVAPNTAESLRRRVGIPVLAVSRAAESPYARMLIAADISPDSVRAGQLARRLFPGAEMTVLHAVKSPYEDLLALADSSRETVEEYRDQALREARERLRLFRIESGFDDDAILEARPGHPAPCIRKRAREGKADVVVLQATRSRRAPEIANGTTQQLLADPPCDVLLAGNRS